MDKSSTATLPLLKNNFWVTILLSFQPVSLSLIIIITNQLLRRNFDSRVKPRPLTDIHLRLNQTMIAKSKFSQTAYLPRQKLRLLTRKLS